MDFEDREDFLPIDRCIEQPKSRRLSLTTFLYKKLMRPKSVRVHAITWNVNSKPPPKHLPQLFIYTADIFVISLQEMGSHDWPLAIDPMLAKDGLIRIKTRKLQGIMMIVYVHRTLLDFVTHIESESTKTGLGGMWGNKGAVSVRFEVYGVSVIFVNSHLAAHDDQLAQRVKDVTEIIDSQKFKDEEVNCILDHDYVFWMGDLNFRLDLCYESALNHVKMNDIPALLAHDQLGGVMREGLIFQDFQESPIRFLPTYKFDVGTDTYDTSQKKRTPSYTDRVVFYHHNVQYGRKNHLDIEVSSYRSHPSFKDSDHKPVSCTLNFLGLSRPQCNPVTFKISKSVSKKFPMHVSYRSRDMELTTSDWIGLYHVEFSRLLTDYIASQSVAINYVLHPFSGNINIPSSTLANLPKGSHYLFCYFSKKYSLCGMSRAFKIKD